MNPSPRTFNWDLIDKNLPGLLTVIFLIFETQTRKKPQRKYICIDEFNARDGTLDP